MKGTIENEIIQEIDAKYCTIDNQDVVSELGNSLLTSGFGEYSKDMTNTDSFSQVSDNEFPVQRLRSLT